MSDYDSFRASEQSAKSVTEAWTSVLTDSAFSDRRTQPTKLEEHVINTSYRHLTHSCQNGCQSLSSHQEVKHHLSCQRWTKRSPSQNMCSFCSWMVHYFLLIFVTVFLHRNSSWSCNVYHAHVHWWQLYIQQNLFSWCLWIIYTRNYCHFLCVQSLTSTYFAQLIHTDISAFVNVRKRFSLIMRVTEQLPGTCTCSMPTLFEGCFWVEICHFSHCETRSYSERAGILWAACFVPWPSAE